MSVLDYFPFDCGCTIDHGTAYLCQNHEAEAAITLFAPDLLVLTIATSGQGVDVLFRGPDAREYRFNARTMETLEEFLGIATRGTNRGVFCSSTLDFPEESTDHQATLDLAHAIRS